MVSTKAADVPLAFIIHHPSFPLKEGSVVSCRFLWGRGFWDGAGLCREGVSQHPGSCDAHDSRCKKKLKTTVNNTKEKQTLR